MNYRENFLRAYRRQQPQWIPIQVGLPPLLWLDGSYDHDDLEDLMVSHSRLFPNYQPGSLTVDNLYIPPDHVADGPYTDSWGCVWETAYTGMVGAVTKHPLADWAAFADFQAPNPDKTDGMRPLDYDKLKKDREEAHRLGFPFGVGLPHGHTFLRIQDLRGYQNLMLDMMDGEPKLDELVQMVEQFNLALIQRFLALKPDVISIPEDLGMQSSPMISPDLFRKYIIPSYRAIMGLIKQRGILIHEHSDGYIMDLIDDIIDAGSEVINLQDLVNGIDNIAAKIKGRISIELDIDRQSITVNGSPADIDAHIREVVMKLGDPQGGLGMCYQPWPPTPIENIRAAMDALEKYSTYYN